MYLKLIENLRRGYSVRNSKPIEVNVAPALIENLRCHRTDEYPILSAEDESPIPPLACAFSKAKNSAHILGLVDENGSVIVYNTNQAGDDSILTEWMAHNNAVFDVEWMAGENKLLTASGDQTVCLWDVPTKARLLTFKGHTSSVRSVGYRPDDNAVFASGSRDGHARLWDKRCNVKVTSQNENCVGSVNMIRNAHTVPLQPSIKRRKARPQPGQKLQDSQQSVTCVNFQNDHLLTTSGAVDGCLKVWDLRKIKSDSSVPVYSFPYSGVSKRTHGFSCLTFDSYYSRLYANCTDDVIYCYDFTTYQQEPLCTYRGHRNTSFYVRACLSPDNQYLLSGSSDECAYIWQVNKPNASPVQLKGHRSEISDVAWCRTDLFRLVTTSDDNSMRVWRFDPTAHIRKKLGQSDASCNISGTAERTHRDIGVSADPGPQTPKHSPCLKRASTFPFGGVQELTPKRAKTTTTSSPSPSIKMWLKRSTSDQSGASDSPEAKKCRLKSSEVGKSPGVVKSSVSGSNSPCKASDTVLPKKISVRPLVAKQDESREANTKVVEMKESSKCVTDGVTKPSCKRKLVDSDNSPDSKRRRVNPINSEINTDENSPSPKKLESSSKEDIVLRNLDLDELSKSPIKSISPRKGEAVLKSLDSKMNSSPIKGREIEFSSPARMRVLNTDFGVSPTSNLPNLVVDGPRTPKSSAVLDDQKKPRTVDWLTQMRRSKGCKSSPKQKSCSKKLLDKLSQSESSIQEGETVVLSPKVKASLKGIRPITSFLHRHNV